LKDGKEVVLPLLPIVPLVGSAATEVLSPRWPTLTAAELHALAPQLAHHLGRVAAALIGQNVGGGGRWPAGP
jgi:hypothetical protein